MTIKIRIKRGTSEYLSQTNPVLGAGEPCLETDTNKVKYGDGTTPWNLLEYSNGGDVPSFGTNNEATGTDAFVGGGSGNTASGTSAFIGGGENNTASGDRSSVVGGMNNVAEGESSLCAGKANTASGTNSVAIGKDSVASLPSQVAISSGKFKSPGDSQTCIYQLRVQTTSSSDILMGLDGVADSSNYLEVPPGTVWFFEVSASAYDVTSVAAATWKFRGGIKNDSEFAFVGTPSSESWKDSEWDSSADLTLEAGSESQPSGLCLVATGVEGKNIYWTATVTTTELKPKPPLTSDMFVDVTADAQITSLEVSIDGSSESLFPAFDTDIQDYCIHSFANGTDSYTLTINGNTTTGTIDVNKALHVMYGAQEYFIRVLPTDLLIPTLVTKTSGYVPGYYLCSLHEATGGSYFAAFNENLVPVWYTHDDRNSTFALLCTVPNKLVLHTGSLSTRYAVELGMNEMTATNYTMQNEETNSNPIWECHESHMVAGPPERAGNFISMTYAYGCGGTYMPGNGMYIQELSADGQTVVWEWYSDDYFNLNGTGDYFHANSIDVNPVTGDLLISCRNAGGGFCIDYATKDVKWILQGVPCCGGGMFSNVVRPGMMANTKYLTIIGDPYDPPKGNHDARWHPNIPPLTPGNQVISFYDNKTQGGPYARGVVYEIDLNTNQAIFRAHAHSETGTSSVQGGFTLVKELNGSYSHVPTYRDMSPVLVEYNNGTNLDPNQNVVFSVNMFDSGGFYRIVKVRPDFLDIDFMRTTAGRTLTLP